MENMILLHVENRFLKGVLLKSTVNTGIGILDIIDIDDLSLKLDAFSSGVCMAVLEITDWNMNSIQVEIDHLKTACPSIPLMAVVTKDTADIVAFAMRAGIRDILLLPKNRELYVRTVQEKMSTYYERFHPKKQEKEQDTLNIKQSLVERGLKEYLKMELKRAQRGKYPLSMVMAHLSGEAPEAINRLVLRLKKWLRETDKILHVDEHTLLGVFPFTQKEDVPIIEEKLREASEIELGKMRNHKKLCLYGTTYPQDETVLDMLLERMENGINNSLVINTIKSPLNVLSRVEIEEYKQKIRQYKKFL